LRRETSNVSDKLQFSTTYLNPRGALEEEAILAEDKLLAKVLGPDTIEDWRESTTSAIAMNTLLRLCSGLAGLGVIVLVPLAMRAAAAESWLFWSHPTGIGRSQLNGSDPTAEFISGFQVEGLAAAVGRDQLFWSDLPPTVPVTPSGVLRTSRLDGSNNERLVGQLPHPGAIALDDEHGLIYWTDLETMEIMRSQLDGSSVETVLPAQPEISDLGGLVIDAQNDKLYFSYVNPLIDGLYPGAIGRLDLANSVVDSIVAGLSHPEGLALHQDVLFWADDLLASGGVIGRVELDSGDPSFIVTELQSPVGLAIDPMSELLYWTDWRAGTVQRSNLDGSDRTDILTGLNQPRALALAVVPEPSAGLLLLIGWLSCIVGRHEATHTARRFMRCAGSK
jgi:hypothetical protein